MTRRLDELNALEEAEAEKVSGIPITNLEEKGTAKVALLGALAWVHKKRTEPKLKYTDYMKSVRTREIADYILGDPEDEAVEAAIEGAGEDGDAAGEEELIDPFLGEVAPSRVEAERGREADAEGAVLPRDGVLA